MHGCTPGRCPHGHHHDPDRVRSAQPGRRVLAAALLALGLLGGVAPPAQAATAPSVVDASNTAAAAPALPAASPPSGPDARSVERLYLAYFGRQADAAGLAHWQQVVRGGRSIAAVSEEFARSPEFTARYGVVDDGGFVDLVYRNVLGRSADDAGRRHWVGVLAAGGGRGAVMAGFSDSGEFKARTGLVAPPVHGPDELSVHRLYRAFFDRDGDLGGLTSWQTARAGGMALDTVADHFATSPEFASRYGSLDDAAFVDLVYRNVLGREADGGGRAYWTEQLRRGRTRGSVMLGFSDSVEFKLRTGLHPAGGITSVPTLPAPAPAPAPPAAPADSYRLMVHNGRTLRWNPCGRTIDVVANFTGAPAGAEAAVTEAIAKMGAGMGVEWRYLGTTTERAASDTASRPLADPARYGDRWSPVLVSWPSTWSATAVGLGGPIALDGGDASYVSVSGNVKLSPHFRPRSHAQLVTLLMHELGHVAGLSHPAIAGQVMSTPLSAPAAEWGAGDLAGLALAGPQQGCLAEPPYRAATLDGFDASTPPPIVVTMACECPACTGDRRDEVAPVVDDDGDPDAG